jgi:hypothetical protein
LVGAKKLDIRSINPAAFRNAIKRILREESELV